VTGAIGFRDTLDVAVEAMRAVAGLTIIEAALLAGVTPVRLATLRRGGVATPDELERIGDALATAVAARLELGAIAGWFA
jgi:chromosome segregation and condensation protein ScpB